MVGRVVMVGCMELGEDCLVMDDGVCDDSVGIVGYWCVFVDCD